MRSKTAKGYVPNGSGTPFSTVTEKKSSGFFPCLPSAPDDPELFVASALENDDYWMQEKLDGRRIILQVEAGNVTGSNRNSIEVAVPESVANYFRYKLDRYVFDGELIGDRYMIFDVLEHCGQDVRSLPLSERYTILLNLSTALMAPNASPNGVFWVLYANSTESKTMLLEQLRSCDREGVVFKKKDSTYVPGRTKEWIKVKFWKTATVVVTQVNDKRSVAMGVGSKTTAEIIPIGNVTIPANAEIPHLGDLIEVRYLYAYPNGSLFQPTYLGLRDDVPIDTLESLSFKSETEDD